MSKKIVLASFSIIFTTFVVSISYVWFLVKIQGHSKDSLSHIKHSTVTQKEDGSYSIRSSSWSNSQEAQGFVVAGERLFQMDLMRRKADGALSELFGESALYYDRKQRLQDWRYYATVAYQNMPENQRISCDAYTKGVNEFISKFPEKVGIEYKILRAKPHIWSCVDSLLIALLMTDQMTHGWERDVRIIEWKNKLPEDWFNFLIPTNHPWNQLWFVNNSPKVSKIGPPATRMHSEKIDIESYKATLIDQTHNTDGSNSWAYRGNKGAWLTNDPHLGYQVPQLWMPLQIEFDTDRFVVGTALPGVPGVLIGMNENLAWSITNTGEDVDDGMAEDQTQILGETTSEIKIKNHPTVQIKLAKTRNGPVVERNEDGTVTTRSWLPLFPGNLGVPAESIAKSRDWIEFNEAIDEFKFVPLNFTMLDKHSNMGLRISGCDLPLKNSQINHSSDSQSASDSDCTTTTRRRLYKPFSKNEPSAFISTANEQLWDDGKLHNWADDDRANRIREVLTASPELTLNDMRLLQLDTKSKFHQTLLRYLVSNGDRKLLSPEQANEWFNWSGDSRDCDICMTEADSAAKLFDQIIVNKTAKFFEINDIEAISKYREMKRSRVLKVLENDLFLDSLGIEKQDLCNSILTSLSRTSSAQLMPWSEKNKNLVQHPFVGRVPIIEKIFALAPYAQYGSSATVRSEKSNHGPSMRLIWSPSHPKESLWAFPIGISGHAQTKHYSNWLNNWQNGSMSTIPF